MTEQPNLEAIEAELSERFMVSKADFRNLLALARALEKERDDADKTTASMSAVVTYFVEIADNLHTSLDDDALPGLEEIDQRFHIMDDADECYSTPDKDEDCPGCIARTAWHRAKHALLLQEVKRDE